MINYYHNIIIIILMILIILTVIRIAVFWFKNVWKYSEIYLNFNLKLKSDKTLK